MNIFTLPEWLIIVLAIFSARCVWSYFGGPARAIARLWVVIFYLVVWFDIGHLDTPALAAISRYGLAVIFLSDIIPAIVAKVRRRWGKKYDLVD